MIVALSVGQTKIGTAVLDSSGEMVRRIPQVPSPKGNRDRALYAGELATKTAIDFGINDIHRIGISFPECFAPPARFVRDSDTLPPQKHAIQQQIENTIGNMLQKNVEIEILHDAGAAVLGEVSKHGSAPGCRDCMFIVWGTGIASGVVRDGYLYWWDPDIDIMVSEAGLLGVHTSDGEFQYRPSPRRLELDKTEKTLDGWLSGPPLTERLRNQILADSRRETLLKKGEKQIQKIDLPDINLAAKNGDPLALELIETAGAEMGAALVPLIRYWKYERKMQFADTIIIGSGVAKLGTGVQHNGNEVLIKAIRNRITFENYDVTGISLSKIGYEREFYAFSDSK